MIRYNVIPPPADESTDLQQVRLIIDSRDRDITAYPTSTSYSIALPQDIFQVKEITLKSAWFPFTAYGVNANNNTLVVTLGSGGTPTTLTLPCGDYTHAALASALQAALQTTISMGFTVTYVESSDTLSVLHAAQPFSLDFTGPNSISKQAGFGTTAPHISIVNPSGGYMLSSPHRMDLDDYNRFVILTIDQLDNLVSPGNAINRAFGILFKQKMLLGIDQPCIKVLNPPIARLSRMIISVTDRYGNLYGGVDMTDDHVFEFTVLHDTVRKAW